MGWFVYFEAPSGEWDRRYCPTPDDVIELVKRWWGTRTTGRFATRVVLEVDDVGLHSMAIELIDYAGLFKKPDEILARIVPESWGDWELGWKQIFTGIAEARLGPFGL